MSAGNVKMTGANEQSLELAVVAGVINMQGLTLLDGTTLLVEIGQPQLVYAVVRKTGDAVDVISMHATQGEADKGMLREAGAGGGETVQ